MVAFAVTLEFEDVARLRKFVADRLFNAREKKFRTRTRLTSSGLEPGPTTTDSRFWRRLERHPDSITDACGYGSGVRRDDKNEKLSLQRAGKMPL